MAKIPMEWYPRAHRVSIDPGLYRDGGSMLTAYPWRFVLHTTEGPTIAGAEQTFQSRRMWPHFCADPTKRVLRQYLPFSRAGRTLDNDPGGVETNRGACIQIELVGFADRVNDTWTADACEWLGSELAGLFDAFGIVKRSTVRPWVDATDGFVAREGAPQRMTLDEWAKFDGYCGHSHSPEDDHYDPGHWNTTAFERGLNGTMEDPDMTPDELLDALESKRGQALLVKAVKHAFEATQADGKVADGAAIQGLVNDLRGRQVPPFKK